MLEYDPNGIDQHAPGAKVDAGKPTTIFCISQFFKALAEVNKVSLHGAEKYTRNGWREVPSGEERYAEAMTRHLAYHVDGELYDKDSGLLHVAHMAWNALAVLWFVLRSISQSTPKPQVQTSAVEPDLTSSQLVQRQDLPKDGEQKLTLLPEKYTGRITILRNSENTSQGTFQSSIMQSSTLEHSNPSVYV